jgi:hypothetical protein
MEKQEALRKAKEEARKKKQTMTIAIAVGSVVVIGIVGAIIWSKRKRS